MSTVIYPPYAMLDLTCYYTALDGITYKWWTFESVPGEAIFLAYSKSVRAGMTETAIARKFERLAWADRKH